MIDSHCHLGDEAFTSDLEAVVGRARAAGLAGALCIVDLANPVDVGQAQRVKAFWPEILFAVGIHPHQANQKVARENEIETTVRRAMDAFAATRAVGEIGLDYHYEFASREVQQGVFRRQVWLARELGRPVVIHAREADADTLAILREEGRGDVRGVFHCFTGDAQMARRVLDLGFHISFSGIVTFRRADDLREVAKIVPSDRLLVETDSPYLAPVPYRGKRNEPAHVAVVVDVLAEVRGQTPDEVAKQTSAAFESLFQP